MTQESSKTKGAKKPKASSLHLENPPSTVDEILERGNESANLLNAPVYNLAHRSVIQNLQDQWLLTLPHETNKREGLYMKAVALSEVTLELETMIQAAQGLNISELQKEEYNQKFE